MQHPHQKRERLKELKSKIIPDFDLEIAACKKRVQFEQKSQQELQKALNAHMDEAAKLTIELTPKPSVVPKVSDHALVRYLERKHGFDLDKFRDEILTEERIKSIQAGASTIKCDGIKFKIADNVVVTAYE